MPNRSRLIAPHKSRSARNGVDSVSGSRCRFALTLVLVSSALHGGVRAQQPPRTPSARTVIERYINAIGGKKAIEQILSADMSGRVTTADGRSGTFTQRSRRPHLFSVSLSWGDVRWGVGFNGSSAWQDDSAEGLRTLYGPGASRVRAEASYVNTRFVLPEKLNQVLLVGHDRVRDRAVVVLTAVTSDGTRRTLFFDADSYLLLKDEQETDDGVEQRLFDDYRRVDLVMEPHRIEWRRNGETLQIVVERVAHNAALDEQMFDVPVPPTAPRLDADAVLSAVTLAERRVNPLRTSYAYTRSTSSARMDEQGRVTRREGATHEVFHLGDRLVISKLVRKEGGQPLSEAQRVREDERVTNIVREYERQHASGQPARVETPRAAANSTSVWIPLLGSDWLPRYLRMSTFGRMRRERNGGRPVIVVEFQPKRGVSPNDEFERQAGTMAGTLWIDEASQQVMRMESHFRDDYHRTVQGSSLRAERALINDEIWLPSRSELNMRQSFAFGNLTVFFSSIQFSDYKKFTVGMDTTIALPDP